MSPQRVMAGTRSPGAALMLWFVGIVYVAVGAHVYIEYGLSVPRYWIHGVEQSVPRSGGDLNYLSYVYRRPAYRRGTVLFVPTVFSICFIILGNVAGNSLQFASRVLLAAGHESPSNGAVRGIAVASAVFACFIHAFSRRGGLVLNNALAMVKVAILVLIVATAIAAAAGAFGGGVGSVVSQNLSAATSFSADGLDGGGGDSYGYVRAFLAIVFTFSGFEQPNYVLGEISRPRRTFPLGMGAGVAIIAVLYMLVNVSYMVVVPRADQTDHNVALRFFELTYGRIAASGATAPRLFNAFLAISSIGNVVVMTYTAARMKQEIAKEGILPWSRFFAQNTDLSVGRALRWLRARGRLVGLLRRRWFSPEHHTERTPVGALTLHLAFCMVLIFATYTLSADDAYTLMTSLTSYVVNCFFGALVGVGILVLRLRGPPPTAATADFEKPDPGSAGGITTTTITATTAPTWAGYVGRRFPHWLSMTCASIFVLANLYPVVAAWVPPSSRFVELATPTHQWYVVPVVAWCIIALGAAWWLGFLAVARREERRRHRVFVIERRPNFGPAAGGAGENGASAAAAVHDDDSERQQPQRRRRRRKGGDGYVLIHETVYLSWVGKETVREEEEARRHDAAGGDDGLGGGGGGQGKVESRFAGTDFDGYY
jgi:amino acid transporter